jgi:integrase
LVKVRGMKAPGVKIDLPYVYNIRDRHGNPRVYFWRGRGHPRIRLREQPGTTAFQIRYEELLRPEPTATGRLAPRTWRWLCALYFASPQYQRLAANTQKSRRLALEATCREPVAPGTKETFADFPLDRLTSKAIRVLRDRKAADTPHAANGRLKAVRVVFEWALEAEHVRTNPARDVALIKAPSAGHHAWTVAEIEQFEQRHPIGSKARLALDLLVYTGARRSDVVLLGRQHVRDGWLKFTQVKTKVPVDIPMLPALQTTITASPTGDLTYLVGKNGRPLTPGAFSRLFGRWCGEAGLTDCSAHGLRKASAIRAAEAGASVHTLMAIYGWLTMGEAQRYTEAVRRKKLSGDALVLLQRPNEAKDGT